MPAPSFTYPAPCEGYVGVYRHSGPTLDPCQSDLEPSSDLCCFPARSQTQRGTRAHLDLTEQAATDWVLRVRAPGPGATSPLFASCRGSHAAVGIGGRLEGLTQDLQQLQESERQLDHLIHICTAQLRLLSEDSDSQRYPWIFGMAPMEDRTGGWASHPSGTVRLPWALDSGEGSRFGCKFWAQHLLVVMLDKLLNLSEPQLHL